MRDQFDISWVFETTEFDIAQVACIKKYNNKFNGINTDLPCIASYQNIPDRTITISGVG